MVVAGLAGLIAIVGLFIFGKDSAGQTATEFMTALAKGNVDKLVDLSYYGTGSKEDLRRKWDFAVHRAAPHYVFSWKITNVVESDPKNAAATVMINRTYDAGGYEEKYQLPMVLVDGQWRVDVRAINHSMYPAIPR